MRPSVLAGLSGPRAATISFRLTCTCWSSLTTTSVASLTNDSSVVGLVRLTPYIATGSSSETLPSCTSCSSTVAASGLVRDAR